MTYPGPVLAAAVLAAEGVSFLLVGSAALWLHGSRSRRRTPNGRIDCLLERGRLDWDRLALSATVIPVADVGVRARQGEDLLASLAALEDAIGDRR